MAELWWGGFSRGAARRGSGFSLWRVAWLRWGGGFELWQCPVVHTCLLELLEDDGLDSSFGVFLSAL